MAADAPGIQIGAINPRKAALELQPNVSRPAITRPSPLPSLANCYRVRNIEANSFFRSRKTINYARLFFIRKKNANFNLIITNKQILQILQFNHIYFFYIISRCDYFVVACDYFFNRDWLRVSLSIKAGKRNIEYSNGRGHKFASASNWRGNRRTEFSDAPLFWGQRGREGGAPHRSEIEIRDVYGREYREKGRRRATCLPDCSTGYVKLLENVGIPWINDEWRARSGNEILRKKEAPVQISSIGSLRAVAFAHLYQSCKVVLHSYLKLKYYY